MRVSTETISRIRAISACAGDRDKDHRKIDGFRLARNSAVAILRVIEFLRMKAEDLEGDPGWDRRLYLAKLERFCQMTPWEMERIAWELLDPDRYGRRLRQREPK